MSRPGDPAVQPAVVEAGHLQRTFGRSRHERHVAVADASLAIRTGESVALVGESGSGKSTLARLMVGLDVPTAGNLCYNGQPMAAVLANRSSRLELRRAVQLIAQDTTTSFDPMRSLRDSIRLPAMVLRGTDQRAADAAVGELLTRLDVPLSLIDRRPDEVSGGQRQRMAIARALVVQPRILVCDEVVSALDVSVQGRILNAIKRYVRESGAGLLFVSHGLPATAFMADTLHVMYRGAIVESGPTPQLLHAPEHEYTRRLIAAFSGASVEVSRP